MMNKQELAKTVADWLLTAPEEWTVDAMARDEKGKPVTVSSDKAVSWCAAGKLLQLGYSPQEVWKWDVEDDYLRKYERRITVDNDLFGREYVAERLLSLYDETQGENHVSTT